MAAYFSSIPSILKKPNWKDVIPEKPEPLDYYEHCRRKTFRRLSEGRGSATSYVYSLNGKLENEITIAGTRNRGWLWWQMRRQVHLLHVHDLQFPPTIYKYDLATKKSSSFRQPEIPGFKSNDYETSEVFSPAKTARACRCSWSTRKGIKLDGNNPTLLYGYGGFNVTTSPSFSALRLALLEQGFVYASANMRGGGEYGEKWHEAGMKLKKQNVFDDFIAAAEYLIKNKYTSPEKLAIQGGSNGGLLVGAVSNQRPELFRAVVEQAGVMDMLRFHKFTIGWNWIADYGSSAMKRTV